MKKQLYVPIWKKTLPDMLDMLELFPAHSSIQLNEDDFKAVGNRDRYGFRLELLNGKIANNIDGSAVPRDLFDTILNNSTACQFLTSKHVIIHMNRNFTLFLKQAG